MRARKYVPVMMASLFLLAGCSANQGQKQVIKQAKRVYDKQTKQCTTTHPETVGNYYNLSRCLDDAALTYAKADPSVSDLVAARIRIRDTVSRYVDSGKLTPEESANAFYTAYEEEKAHILAARQSAASGGVNPR